MNYKHTQEAYALMEEKKQTLTSSWKASEKELQELRKQLDSLNQYLSTGGAESMQSHVHEENHEEEQKAPEDDKSQPQKNIRYSSTRTLIIYHFNNLMPF